MIVLKYNEKPEDWRTKNYKSERLEWGNAHSDVMWYTEEESRIKRISEIKDDAFREELLSCLSQWHDLAKEGEDQWPVKYASVEFWTREGKFVIYPWDIGSDISEYEFEMIQWTICGKLTELGAVKIWYTGMLD